MNRVSVRTLAEFAFEGGDLAGALNGIERMREGMQTHVLQQGLYPKGFQHEVSISMRVEIEGMELGLFGRMDGLDETGRVPLIEEIKTTRLTPSDIQEDDYPVHWAQANIYAYMLCRSKALPGVDVRLAYVDLLGKRQTYTRHCGAEELEKEFYSYAVPYVRWLKLLDARQERVLPTLRALQFPYNGYREGQRDMAVNAYRAFKNHVTLLCQAPTGIGKTVASLFPALKAIGTGQASRVFYLTARGTTAQAAEDALELMRKNGLICHSIRLIAKEKLCITPGTRCDPIFCPRAVGYYDRRRDALREAVGIEKLTREKIEYLANKYELCPFELSLDLSETSDVIICDYNYAFDPRIKLKRYFMDKTDSLLLVDEAHNLIDRGRDMLTASLSQKHLRALRKELGALGDMAKKTLVYEKLSALILLMQKLAKKLEQPSCDLEPPFAVSDAAVAFTEAAGKMLDQISTSQTFMDCYFEALDFARVADEYSDEHRTLLEKGEDGNLTITLWCFDPSKYLRKCYKKTRGCMLFSATLSPMEYYARMLGIEENEGDAQLDLPSPFPADNLCVVRMPVSTRYRTREENAGQIAETILTMCRAHRGNYIACLPSYAYLRILEEHLRAGAGRMRVVAQRPGMDDTARERFLQEFHENDPNGLLALVVMGGVFAEGIDLPGELLSGAAIVGVGLPMPSFEKEALREVTDDGFGCGMHYAYTYPGLQRVLQAAGRVIRTENDTGVVLLLDDRYMQEFYEELLPPHWQPHTAEKIEDLQRTLKKFWRNV